MGMIRLVVCTSDLYVAVRCRDLPYCKAMICLSASCRIKQPFAVAICDLVPTETMVNRGAFFAYQRFCTHLNVELCYPWALGASWCFPVHSKMLRRLTCTDACLPYAAK